VSNGPARVGQLLEEGWALKKRMASNVTNGHLDELHGLAKAAGAVGAKVSGAGGGGCLLVFAEPETQAHIRRALRGAGLDEVPFTLEPEGSRIIYYGM
jgi:D-glycero-alpha-D-manno-heptose-7-phosphate kinase